MKATFAVTIIVPIHLTAISNMPEKSCTHLESNPPKKKIVFHTSPKMSTYLLAWAVGKRSCWNDRCLRALKALRSTI